jgi:hypothetical protein
MATFTPILTTTPSNPPTYNFGIAETFSWVPIQNDIGRPLFAKATFSVNRSDNQGQDGFDFLKAGVAYTNNYTAIHTILATQFAAISADNSDPGPGGPSGSMTTTTFPANFKINGPIRSVTLASGAALGYK